MTASSAARPVTQESKAKTGGRGLLMPDTFIDFADIERRELNSTLKVLAIALVIGTIIVAVSLFLVK